MRAAWGVVAVTLACLAQAHAQGVEFVVVSDSAAIGYPRGSVLEDGAAVTVAPGARLSLLDSSGRSQVVAGPFAGAIHAGSGAAVPSMMGAIQQLIASNEHRHDVAAIRAAPGRPQPANPHAIDTGDEATQCASSNAPVTLWRAPPQRHSTLFLTRLATGEHADVDWPSNRAAIPWPDAVPRIDGETYQAAIAGELSKARFMLRVLAFDKPTPEAAQRLAAAGCRRQALDMLDAVIEGRADATGG